MSNAFYADQQLTELFGKRPEGIPLLDAFELGWACPVNPKHKITFSEFKAHIWCYSCQRDYFTLLCPKRMNPFISEDILREETEMMAPLMAKWTLWKYRNLTPKLLATLSNPYNP